MLSSPLSLLSSTVYLLSLLSSQATATRRRRKHAAKAASFVLRAPPLATPNIHGKLACILYLSAAVLRHLAHHRHLAPTISTIGAIWPATHRTTTTGVSRRRTATRSTRPPPSSRHGRIFFELHDLLSLQLFAPCHPSADALAPGAGRRRCRCRPRRGRRGQTRSCGPTSSSLNERNALTSES